MTILDGSTTTRKGKQGAGLSTLPIFVCISPAPAARSTMELSIVRDTGTRAQEASAATGQSVTLFLQCLSLERPSMPGKRPEEPLDNAVRLYESSSFPLLQSAKRSTIERWRLNPHGYCW
jgi:hypothetical protein